MFAVDLTPPVPAPRELHLERLIVLTVRRFVCEVAHCRRRIFCERLPRTAAAYARRTGRLTNTLEVLELTTGGEAGARLAAVLGMAVSPEPCSVW